MTTTTTINLEPVRWLLTRNGLPTWPDLPARRIVPAESLNEYDLAANLIQQAKDARAFVFSDWNKRIADSKFSDNENFASVEKGHIALQDHGDDVWYRNIKIKPLCE